MVPKPIVLRLLTDAVVRIGGKMRLLVRVLDSRVVYFDLRQRTVVLVVLVRPLNRLVEIFAQLLRSLHQ